MKRVSEDARSLESLIRQVGFKVHRSSDQIRAIDLTDLPAPALRQLRVIMIQAIAALDAKTR